MKKVFSQLLSMLLAVSIILTTTLYVKADSCKIVTLGANLSEEQKELILNYFGVNENEVDVMTVTNEDEHRLLDGIATQSQIGTKTFSCAYIEPTNEGGIHVKTVNLNWVTCEMIRNALVTSGITNCNVIAAAPIEVSGTGSLAGIFLAYEQISGEELSDDKKEIASEELVTTCDIAQDIGQDEASTLLSELKSDVILDNLETEEDITKLVEKYIQDNNIEITDEQKWKLVELLLKISKQDYDINEIKQAYADIKQTMSDIKDATETTMNILEKIWNWLKTTWAKITGTYEEVSQTEEYKAIKEKIGILANTNDSLLGDNTTVTTTDDIENIDTDENKQEQTEEKHWYDWIVKLFNSGNNNIEQEEKQLEETEQQQSEETITFDNVEKTTEEQSEQKEEESENMLDYVTYDFLNEETEENSDSNTEARTGDSLDDLTK